MYAQELCLQGIKYTIQKKQCNKIIDEIIINNTKKKLHVIDRKYKKLINKIANFLESQEIYYNTCITNIFNFYIKLALYIENHRKLQNILEEHSADELFDISETFSFESEDNENKFLNSCQTLRLSADGNILSENFDNVLTVLDDIQSSYRKYHSEVCFISDKYNLNIINEYKLCLLYICNMFNMAPVMHHPIMITYDDIYDETVILNSSYFEKGELII